MADVHETEVRSYNMSQIRAKDTKPEMLVRKYLHSKGFRYRLHVKDLPGKPDIYLRKYNAVIEINGCFWHGHDCHLFQIPKTNTEFWKNKINENRKNDLNNRKKILKGGIRFCMIWECAIKGKSSLDFDILVGSLIKWLNSKIEFKEIEGNY